MKVMLLFWKMITQLNCTYYMTQRRQIFGDFLMERSIINTVSSNIASIKVLTKQFDRFLIKDF